MFKKLVLSILFLGSVNFVFGVEGIYTLNPNCDYKFVRNFFGYDGQRCDYPLTPGLSTFTIRFKDLSSPNELRRFVDRCSDFPGQLNFYEGRVLTFLVTKHISSHSLGVYLQSILNTLGIYSYKYVWFLGSNPYKYGEYYVQRNNLGNFFVAR